MNRANSHCHDLSVYFIFFVVLFSFRYFLMDFTSASLHDQYPNNKFIKITLNGWWPLSAGVQCSGSKYVGHFNLYKKFVGISGNRDTFFVGNPNSN